MSSSPDGDCGRFRRVHTGKRTVFNDDNVTMTTALPREQYVLDPTSHDLLSALERWREFICWADSATAIYQGIQDVYASYTGYERSMPAEAFPFQNSVHDLETYIGLDLRRHVAMRNCNDPYYLDRVNSHLSRALSLLPHLLMADMDASDGKQFIRELDHLAAELQATFLEYGFCETLDALKNVDEAHKKLNAIEPRLAQIQRMLADPDTDLSLVIAELRDVVAHLNGILQAMTEGDIDRISGDVAKRRQQTAQLLSQCSSRMTPDCELYVSYAAAQSLLRNAFVTQLFRRESSAEVNGHMIHPGTRGWLLERLQKWLAVGDNRVFVATSKAGMGKTALSSAVCKLLNYDVVAKFFFRPGEGATVDDLVRTIAAELCRTLPEYLNYLDDELSGVDIAVRLGGSWRESFDVLLKGPLQALYGLPASPNQSPREDPRQCKTNGIAGLLRDPIAAGAMTPTPDGGRRTPNRPRSSRTAGDGVGALMRDPAVASSPQTGDEGDGPRRQRNDLSRRRLVVIDGLHHCARAEWAIMEEFVGAIVADLPPTVCLWLTAAVDDLVHLVPSGVDVEEVSLNGRSWINRHVTDVETYIASSLGAVLSGEDATSTPNRARADEMTLQNTVDALLKSSAGRFDYAIELMEEFAREMAHTGQFLSSLRKATIPVNAKHGVQYEKRVSEFASVFRSYRDREGRVVDVRVIRQSTYLMDKTRVALIRGRHYMNMR